MKNTKKYWLYGLVIGILLGLLVTYAHEHVPHLANFLHVNMYGGSGFEGDWFGWYVYCVQKVYSFGLWPFFFLGLGILFVQYYLPPITYGVLGLVIGLLYKKIKNRDVVPFFTFSKRSVIVCISIVIFVVIAGVYIQHIVERSMGYVSNQTAPAVSSQPLQPQKEVISANTVSVVISISNMNENLYSLTNGVTILGQKYLYPRGARGDLNVINSIDPTLLSMGDSCGAVVNAVLEIGNPTIDGTHPTLHGDATVSVVVIRVVSHDTPQRYCSN